MVTVVLFSIMGLFLAYLGSKNQLKYGLEFGFILVTILEAIHYNFGNDYMNYYSDYLNIASSQLYWEHLFNSSYYKEPGWVVLNYLSSYIGGFFMLVAILSIIQNLIYYNFIKTNLPRKYWYFGFFIYVFSAYDLYLINMSMLRQGLTIALFIYSYKFIKEKRFIISVLIYLFAYTVHSSAIMLLPFAFWSFIPINKKKSYAILIASLFVLLITSMQFLQSVLSELQAFKIVEDYTNTYVDQATGFGFGFAIRLVPFLAYLIVLWNNKIDLKKNEFSVISLASISFLSEPFSQIGELFVRMGYYFNALSIAAIPLAFSKFKGLSLKYFLLFLYVSITIYMYYSYFTNSIYALKSKEYHTIFKLL